MGKKFNITGLCIPEKHYMVDISKKIDIILQMVKDGEYFTINRPRQYGKTTTMHVLEQELTRQQYLVISISFEGVGSLIFEKEERFCNDFWEMLADNAAFNDKEASEYLYKQRVKVNGFRDLSKAVTEFSKNCSKDIVLMIDEVDKSSNNRMFLNFLGMLRNKYLDRNRQKDYTFLSVILAGIYDVKTLKHKLRPDVERKYNSPWNIAADFDVDMSFDVDEISTMLDDYCVDNEIRIDIDGISREIYRYTGGYPFLVSKICKIIDEKLDREWTEKGIQDAVSMLTRENNTLFESLIKNLENNSDLFEIVYDLIIEGKEYAFNPDNPRISKGILFGVFAEKGKYTKIHNKIFEIRIYNYMISKKETDDDRMSRYNFRNSFIKNDGSLDMDKLLQKFQRFMKENYSDKDGRFLEREGRLLFLSFIHPVINGVGFYFTEPRISQDRRLDIVITYNGRKYIIELKIWYGENYIKEGIQQLSEYLNVQNVEKGYMVIFSFNKSKRYEQNVEKINGREIFSVTV